MANIYNSKLIADLLSSPSKRATDILAEMIEIKDPIFLYPIREGFKKFRDASIAHYFLSALAEFEEKEALDITLELMNDPAFNDERLLDWAIRVPLKHDYNSEDLVDRCCKYLENQLSFVEESYEIDPIVSYLIKTDQIKLVKDYLWKILLDPTRPKRIRTYVLAKWLRISPSEHIQYLIDHFESLKKDANLELYIAKEVSVWKGTKSVRLQDLILSNGSQMAAEIISKVRKEKESEKAKKHEEKEKKDYEIYANAPLVDAIATLIDNVNILTIGSDEFGFPLIEKGSGILKQLKVVTDQPSFENACNHLRPVIQGFSDKVHNHGIDEAEAKQLLVGADTAGLRKSVNGLFLYLHAKGFQPSRDLFGLQPLNRIVSLLAHPENQEELIRLLKERECFNIYTAQQWAGLHVHILESYKSFLEQLISALGKKKV